MVAINIPLGRRVNPVLKVNRNMARLPINPILKKADNKRFLNNLKTNSKKESAIFPSIYNAKITKIGINVPIIAPIQSFSNFAFKSSRY